MELLVVGSRSFSDYKTLYELIDYYNSRLDVELNIITLNTKGTCSLAKVVAQEMECPCKVVDIDWLSGSSALTEWYEKIVKDNYTNGRFGAIVIKHGRDDMNLDFLIEELETHGVYTKTYEYLDEKALECSSKGDLRFSDYHAKVTIGPRRDTIHNIFDICKDAKAMEMGVGRVKHAVCPITGELYPRKELQNMYTVLWLCYFKQNIDLLKYASTFDRYTDCFNDYHIQWGLAKNTQSVVIENICKNFDQVMKKLNDESLWYMKVKHLL